MTVPIVDVYSLRRAMKAREDTWGHLAPEFGRRYRGTILVATSPYYELGWTIVRDDFPGLEPNPWHYAAMCDLVNDADLKDGRRYLWSGTYESIRSPRPEDQYMDQQYHQFRGKFRALKLSRLLKTPRRRRG